MSKLKSLSLFVALAAGVIGFQSDVQATSFACTLAEKAISKTGCTGPVCGKCANVAAKCESMRSGEEGGLQASDPNCYNAAVKSGFITPEAADDDTGNDDQSAQ